MLFPTSPELFFSKGDPHDPRLGEMFKTYTEQKLAEDDFAITGYPDDEGIRLNGGRPGASQAPKLVRQFLYKMTPPNFPYMSQFVDLGDLLPQNELEFRHQKALEVAFHHMQNGVRFVSIGGGHDYGFSDAAAFVQAAKLKSSKKPIVINFDAHLDVRPVREKNFNSGTPFYRLLTEFSPSDLTFIELGLQPQCNSPFHRSWAKDHGAHLVYLNEIEEHGWDHVWWQTSLKTIDKSTPVFVSFDIDAIRAADAGGASQAWATGLKLNDCLKFLKRLYENSRTYGMGIYEVSPPFDRDFQTSKSAALLIHHFLFSHAKSR